MLQNDITKLFHKYGTKYEFFYSRFHFGDRNPIVCKYYVLYGTEMGCLGHFYQRDYYLAQALELSTLFFGDDAPFTLFIKRQQMMAVINNLFPFHRNTVRCCSPWMIYW